MIIDMGAETPAARYHWMTQAVIPRPVAWILTENGGENKNYNLAPFSYFNALCSAPPLVGVSMSAKPDGGAKDTLRNIRARGRFVVHIAAARQTPELNESAASLPYGESEISRLNIETESFGESVKIAGCPLALFCALHQEIALAGADEQTLVLGEIKLLYAAGTVLEKDAKGREIISAAKVNPVARLSAGNYANLGDITVLRRPA